MNKDTLIAWLGKTKTAARRVMTAHLKTMPIDVGMDDPKLLALSQFHPTRRFPLSGTVFVLRVRPPFYTKALGVIARSGGIVDFSWVKCIENLYGAYTREKNARANVLSALRNEAFHSKAIQEARAQLGRECTRCRKTCHRLVLDHDGKPFAQIVDEFLM